MARIVGTGRGKKVATSTTYCSTRGTGTAITRQIVQRARREHEGKTIDLADHYGVVADVQLKP